MFCQKGCDTCCSFDIDPFSSNFYYAATHIVGILVTLVMEMLAAVTVVDNVRISLSAASIERYCQELVRYQAKPERRIAALDALRTFIGAMATPGEQAKSEFAAINEILSRNFEQARAEFLSSQCALLAKALSEQNHISIVSLYNALSRDAFWQLLNQAVSILEPTAARLAAVWCNDWLAEVRARSAVVCAYPDTIDFKAAGVEVVEYAAMQDIHHYFATASGLELE